MKQNKIPRNEYIRKPVGKTNPYKDDVIYSNLGQWKYPGQVTRIPSGDITMQGVPYPVYGEDNLGYSQMMYPGMDYQFPGQYVTEIPMAQAGYNFIPNVEYKEGIGSQYDPITETIYIDKTDPEDPDKLLGHELWHHYQNYNNWLRLPEDFPTMKRPQTPANDEQLQKYYNRKKDDVEQISKGFRNRYPDFNFVPDQVLYDRAVNDIQYQQPWTMEGEGRAAESEEGLNFLKDQGYNVYEYLDILDKLKNKKAYGGVPMAQKGKQQVEDRDSWLENIAEIIDPTGISSWDDIYRAYKNTGLSGETALEALGAIPLLGKVGKSGKVIAGGFGLLQDAVKASKYLPTSKQQKFIDKAFDTYQKYNKTGGKELDEALGSTTKILKDKIPYINPTKWSSSDKAINVANKAFKTGRISDAVQAALGSKDNSGFTWDMRHGEVPMYNGRNIFPQIQLGEHGDFAYGGDPSLSDITGHYQIGGNHFEPYSEDLDWLGDKYKDVGVSTLNKGKLNFNIGNYIPKNIMNKGVFEKPTLFNPYIGADLDLNKNRSLNFQISPDYAGLTFTKEFETGGNTNILYPFGGMYTKTYTHMQKGGWLDEYDEDFRKGGNLYTPIKLKRKVRKYGTSKNIQSSINKLFTKNNILHHRNYDVFGPSGRNVYNPNSKYELGGNWLDELPVEQKGGSIVDYLKSKGIDSSKENRAKLAKAYGIKNYDYTAEKNTELLDRLQNAKPVVTKPAAPKPVPSYLQPIKPIEKPNAKSDRTGQKKNVKLVSDADLYSEDAKWYNSLNKEEKEFIKRSTAAQYKEPDELKQYVPQGKISKAWDVITNPVTALEEYHKHGRIPDNLSESPDRNAIDMAVDVINPAFYINAAGRTAKNLTSADTYSDIAKGLGAGALGLMGEEAPDEWVEGGLNTLDKTLDAVTAAQGLKLLKTIPRGYRDMKYKNELTVGKGADKQTFRNSADFLEAHKAKMQAAGKDIPLKKKEVDFLNKEIKQRGILEANRRHPLDPRSAAAKALIVPEDYNWKTVLNPKNIAKNLYKTITEGSPESRYKMGHGRIAGWNSYLGIPTKNNPYRVHPESFTQGENLLYTLPEKQIEKVRKINKKMGEQSSGILSEQISPKKGIRELEFFKNMPAKNTKAFNQKAYDRIASDMRKIKDTNGKKYYSKSDIKELLGPKTKFNYSLKKHRELAGDDFVPDFISRENNVFKTGDWDRYIGSHGGVGWKVVPDEASGKEKWMMEDVWDIQPLSRIQSKAIPQFVKDIDFANILGGKNYKTRLDYFKNPNSNRITPLVPKKTGGWLDNLD